MFENFLNRFGHKKEEGDTMVEATPTTPEEVHEISDVEAFELLKNDPEVVGKSFEEFQVWWAERNKAE